MLFSIMSIIYHAGGEFAHFVNSTARTVTISRNCVRNFGFLKHFAPDMEHGVDQRDGKTHCDCAEEGGSSVFINVTVTHNVTVQGKAVLQC